MTHHTDYFWKNGIPYGIGKIEDPFSEEQPTYKIVMDPYRKHITIEKYLKNVFEKLIYDSSLLNFRLLKGEEHKAWQKSTVSENSDSVICHLRDQDDRLVFKETHLFKNDLCVECHVVSMHGIPISTQRMYYKSLGDSFNGVILYDQNSHPVVFKEYEFDDELNEFTDLISANWDMKDFSKL